MKLYTRRGDDGTTGLLFGGRVDKHDARTDAYGTTDEAVSALGLARAELATDAQREWHERVLELQRELFVVGAQLATDPSNWGRLEPGVSRCTDSMVETLEARIDETTDRYPLPQEFTVPGGSRAGAAIDLARTVVRRAERQVSAMYRAEILPDDVALRYLNRLSDYLFVLARAVEGGAHTPTRDR
ncbi:cob(I)yrinic acid a,c-diamide adenosyltransferase [Egibacter rhizosphaerae]|uniref:Corrinoid adenosyltransferase n=1 Tax=Egibacter rhizosphaerae TaxID=1670831 RepID=A0A411YAN6_9ACTN|nr:cob(I)yrinic acid a,c-diamide adenosyltransferase [Egibacter rhizosphaerae]QBI18242.1 cob(I)yrinic acid a,c-diamide adenosyltransferase [Egibacter rhizosphaerae]